VRGEPSGGARIQLLRNGPKAEQSADDARPHVLLALDTFPRSLGGGERVALRLAKLLPQYGYKVSILTLGVERESSVLTEPAPCPIYLLPLKKTYDLEAWAAARELKRFLREQRVVLVQTFFESSDLWTGPVAKLMAKAKLIWSRRDMGILRGRKHQVAYRMMRRLPDRVFAVSEQVRRHAIEVDGVPAERVETLYSGLDLGSWRARAQGAPSAEPLIVTVGNLRRVKGHDVLVRAAAEVLREFPTARFRIAGDVLEPEYAAELHALVRELGIEERFEFAGGVKDLLGFLGEADVFVLPSRSEGFSNAIIEAMAAGLPVVATDVGGNAEAVVEGVTGRIVRPESVEELASAMRGVLAEPERAREMGRAGRQRVLERFTTEAMMRQLVAAYQKVLGAS
jgi:L-malate glycosyltransferase